MANKIIGMLLSSMFLTMLAIVVPVYQLFFKAEIANPETRFLFFMFTIIFLTGLFICMIGWFVYHAIGRNNKYGDSFGFYGMGQKPSSAFWRNWSRFIAATTTT